MCMSGREYVLYGMYSVCVSGQVGEGGACINMPRFGRTVVSLYSLGSW